MYNYQDCREQCIVVQIGSLYTGVYAISYRNQYYMYYNVLLNMCIMLVIEDHRLL